MNHEYLVGSQPTQLTKNLLCRDWIPTKWTKTLMVNWSSSLLDKSSKPITSLRNND